MRTTVDLPDDLLEQTKIAAAKRRTSVKSLIVAGLEYVLSEESGRGQTADALSHLRAGYYLGGKPLTREQAHGR